MKALLPSLRPRSSRRFAAACLWSCLTWAALAAETSLNFIAMGDWGRDGQFGQQDVADQMGRTAAETGTQFVISLGDNFYPDGVPSVEAPQWQTSYEKIYRAPSLQVPWYVLLGNHDYQTNAQAQIDYTLHSPRWKMPARYYSVTRRVDSQTTAQFFFLDTNAFITSYRNNPAKYKGVNEQDSAAQLAWLERELARSSAQWKIVCGHHPILSASEKHGDTEELLHTVLPLLRQYGVQIYLNGHEHDMQHLSQDGIHYFCSGAASQTRPTQKDHRSLFSLGETGGFLAVTLSAEQFSARFIDAAGKVRHDVSLARNVATAPAVMP